MNCDTPTSTELHFLSSGIKIAPLEATYKRSSSEFEYLRVTITTEAANFLNDNADIPEPVEIYVDGTELCSLYIPNDGIRIGTNQGHVELYDPRKFLDRGTIDKVFEKISLDNVVTWFRDRVNEYDDNNIINDIQFIGGEGVDPDETTENFNEYRDVEGMETPEEMRNLRSVLAGLFDSVEEEGGFDFNQITLAEVLQRIEQQFQINSYVDSNRNLRIGIIEQDSNLYVGGEGDDVWNVSDYNITVDPSEVSQVYVKGGYIRPVNTIETGSTGIGVPTEMKQANNQKLQLWGYATISNKFATSARDIPGKSVSVNAGSVTNGEQLEQIAIRRIREEIASQASGNIEVNCIASPTNVGNPQDIKPKDVFGLIPPTEGCNIEIPETIFVVEEVQHEIKPGSWILRLSLSQIPQDNIHSASFKTAPTSAEFMSSEEFYEQTMDYSGGLNLDSINED